MKLFIGLFVVVILSMASVTAVIYSLGTSAVPHSEVAPNCGDLCEARAAVQSSTPPPPAAFGTSFKYRGMTIYSSSGRIPKCRVGSTTFCNDAQYEIYRNFEQQQRGGARIFLESDEDVPRLNKLLEAADDR